MLSWSFELLNRRDQKIRDLDGVTGGSCEIVAQSTIGGSADITIDGDRGIDWLNHRVRAIYHDGPKSWPVGTYRFTSPKAKYTAFGVTYQVGLKTKMSIPQGDTTEGRFTLPAGTNVIAAVDDMLQSTGETRIAVTASAKTLAGPLTWEEATPKLQVINDLLQYAGYWSLWCDGSGLYRIEPYVDPASRPVAYEFEHGEASVHFPDWEHEQDHSSVPNKFVAVGSRRGDDEPPLVGVARNMDPGSPYSYPSLGVWTVEKETGVEADSQQVIDQIAARRLADLMSPVSRLTVSHKMLNLDPNQLVSFTPEDGQRRLATIQRMSMRFEDFTDVDAEWRQA